MNGQRSAVGPAVGKTSSSGVVAAVVVVLVLVIGGTFVGVIYLAAKSALFRELVIALALVVAAYRTLTKPGRDTQIELQKLYHELRNRPPQ